ncbi:hypothetical protein PHLCEN_2v10146 [Hermanssonia centrifuga]|uniref:Uncharacterized protein n=1 Tax=Hermanssonia centrifuga TaxID=98765 RepID=A0A2R6NNQ4_9APHY|nr:hypothetical protein PHLCEN_2v10146 [Hermanssonia centrifuga]
MLRTTLMTIDPGRHLELPEVLVEVTVAAGVPKVGVGTGLLAPFIPNATSESCANPTEAGDARKTE